jgi:hypothetical protein
MELVAFIIAVAIAYQALKGYRLTKQRTLWYVHLGFAALSAGLLVDSLAGFLGIIARTLRGTVAFTVIGYEIYFLAQLVAYGLLTYAYVSHTRTLNTISSTTVLASLFGFITLQATPAFPIRLLGPLVEYHPIPEIVLLLLVTYIAIQTGLNYSATKDQNALFVFVAFLLLALSHLFFILEPFRALFFVAGHVLQLLGYVSLLTMLVRVATTR